MVRHYYVIFNFHFLIMFWNIPDANIDNPSNCCEQKNRTVPSFEKDGVAKVGFIRFTSIVTKYTPS